LTFQAERKPPNFGSVPRFIHKNDSLEKGFYPYSGFRHIREKDKGGELCMEKSLK
jgi:hypothetical protein